MKRALDKTTHDVETSLLKNIGKKRRDLFLYIAIFSFIFEALVLVIHFGVNNSLNLLASQLSFLLIAFAIWLWQQNEVRRGRAQKGLLIGLFICAAGLIYYAAKDSIFHQ